MPDRGRAAGPHKVVVWTVSARNPARVWTPRGAGITAARGLLRSGFLHRLRPGAAVVLTVVEIAVAVAIGGREAFNQLGIRRRFRHRDAAVLVAVERVEAAARGRTGGGGGLGAVAGNRAAREGRRENREREGGGCFHDELLYWVRKVTGKTEQDTCHIRGWLSI